MVGIPHEDVGAKVDAGAVELFSATGDAASMVTQNRAGAGGAAEAGDRYGASVAHWWTFVNGPTARLAIGVPGEDIGSTVDAGIVSFATWTMPPTPEDPMPALKGMAETQHQNSPNVPGAVERGDRYGAGVLAGEFGQDDGREHLVVGAPYEDLGSVGVAGQLSQTQFETDASPSTGRNESSRGRRTRPMSPARARPVTGSRPGSARCSSPRPRTTPTWCGPWCCSPCRGRTYRVSSMSAWPTSATPPARCPYR